MAAQERISLAMREKVGLAMLCVVIFFAMLIGYRRSLVIEKEMGDRLIIIRDTAARIDNIEMMLARIEAKVDDVDEGADRDREIGQ